MLIARGWTVTAGLLLAMVMGAQSAGASPIELVTNGGFETGTLSGWTTSGLGSGVCGSANHDWNVSNSGTATGCLNPGDPSGSTYAAYVENDGTGPLTYRLFQSIFVPLGTTGGQLSFDWESVNNFDAGRLLTVLLNGTNVFSSSTSGSFSWTPESVNVSAILAAAAGTSITLEFDNSIPRFFTGPGGLGLDNASVQAQVSAVPEPGTVTLLGLGLLGATATRMRKRKSA